MVVTNSDPLMALGKLNYLNLLAKLYKKVFMPNAVYSEVVERGFAQGCLDSLQVKMALKRNYLEVMSIKSPNSRVEDLPLQFGEKEALNLALENKASLILMDDLLAREQAQKLGLIVM